MEFWLDIAGFALKALLIVGSVGALAILIARLTRGEREEEAGIEIKSLNRRYSDDEARLKVELLSKKERKAFVKARKKAAKTAEPAEKCIYALSFKGDVTASAVGRLGREIDAVLSVARPQTDEVVIRIHSPGGTVTGYGLAAAQLRRLRDRSIKLTATVDQVAASGGYLMACVADRILAAPFAIVGSIGVVAQVPNVNRLLKKNDIDFEEITAGEFKRTVSVFGEITPAGREHFRGKLDSTHEAFKAYVKHWRANVDIDRIANGDIWLGSEALALGLVDDVTTSDDYLFRARDQARLFEISLQQRRSIVQQWLTQASAGLAALARSMLSRFGLETTPLA